MDANAATSLLSHGSQPPPLHIEAEMVEGILEIYSEQFRHGNIFFRFESGFLSLKELLEIVVSKFRALIWPIDKEELARIWHSTIIIPYRRRPDDFTGYLGDTMHTRKCTMTLLDPRLLNLTTYHVPVDAPRLYRRNAGEMEMIHTPTHEVNLTTIWTDWFRHIDTHMKRLIIPKGTPMTTLLLGQERAGLTEFRYSLLWLPHVHLNGTIWNNCGHPAGMRFIPMQFRCARNANPSYGLNITCIIWNSHGAGLPTILRVLHYLLLQQNPYLIIITETWLTGEEVQTLATSVGYAGVHGIDVEGDRPGFWILWRPAMITVSAKLSAERSLHVLIEVAEARSTCTIRDVN